MFNSQQFLNDYGIPFWTSGKNVSTGWVTISCPFCGDRSNHGGISPSGMGYSCLKCGPKGHIVNLIKKVVPEASWSDVQSIFSTYSNALYLPEVIRRERANNVVWPPVDAEKTMPSIFAQYLNKRRYVPSQIEALYGVKCVYLTGSFKYRLVIPIIQNGRVVTYVGRDITGQSQLRYKNLKEEESIIPAKECVYGIDEVGDTGIIVEGITDKWRLKYNTVAMQGLMFTRTQVRLLSKKLKRAVIAYDNEPNAQEMARALAEELSLAGVDTDILYIDKKDPDDLSENEAEEIRKLVFT